MTRDRKTTAKRSREREPSAASPSNCPGRSGRQGQRAYCMYGWMQAMIVVQSSDAAKQPKITFGQLHDFAISHPKLH